MTTVEKLGVGLIGIGMATTVLLPGRQTVGVIDAIRRLFTGALGTAMASPVRK
jgi:hypothetical protein